MSQYYKTIKGQRYDRQLLELATELSSGAGDGRISKADAQILLDAVFDAGRYTPIEKTTVAYIQQNYTFTAAADRLFRNTLQNWQTNQSTRSAKKTKKRTSTAAAKKSKNGAGRKQTTPTSNSAKASAKAEPPYWKTGQRQRLFVALFVIVLLLSLILLCFLYCPWCQQYWRAGPVSESTTTQNPSRFEKELSQSDDKTKAAVQELEGTYIQFAKNNRRLSDSQKQKIRQQIATIIQKHPHWKIEVQGHTCNEDRSGANQRISTTRARRVYQALIDIGIPAPNLSFKGYSDSQPLVSNATAAGRAQNRRVSFKVY